MNSGLIERLAGQKFVNLARIFCDKVDKRQIDAKKVCAEEFLLDGSSDCKGDYLPCNEGITLIPAYEARPLFLITLSSSQNFPSGIKKRERGMI